MISGSRHGFPGFGGLNPGSGGVSEGFGARNRVSGVSEGLGRLGLEIGVQNRGFEFRARKKGRIRGSKSRVWGSKSRYWNRGLEIGGRNRGFGDRNRGLGIDVAKTGRKNRSIFRYRRSKYQKTIKRIDRFFVYELVCTKTMSKRSIKFNDFLYSRSMTSKMSLNFNDFFV